MKPYYEHAGITIYHGDCREVLPQLERADLVLTDPPYGHADKWSGGTWAANPMYDDAMSWDRSTPDASALWRVLLAAPNAVIWGGNYFSLPPSRCWLGWLKTSVMPTLADFELAWTSLDAPAKAFREDRNPDGKRWHPTQKPLSLMSWCLGFFPSAKKVIDPYCGSGSVLVAAKNLERRAIGIEIEEKYCEIAAKRLSQEVFNFDGASS